MIITDDPLIYGVPRSWCRAHRGLPISLADAGFGIFVAHAPPGSPITYELRQGCPFWRADAVHSPAGTIPEIIAWGLAWLESQGLAACDDALVQLSLFGEGI